jgi:tetratricopeptide (TPR) repeat protein
MERQINSILSEAIRAERYGRHETAYLKYKEVLTKSPNNDSAQRGANRLKPIVDSSIRRLLSRGKQQFQSGNYDEARQIFSQVLQASPGHQEASRYINRIILAKNQQAETHYNTGLGYYNSKEWTAALSEFDRALAFKPDHGKSLQMRKQALASMSNEILMEQGDAAYKRLDFLKAWSLYSQVLKNDPNYSQINEKLERCQTKLRERVELFFDEGMTFYSQQKYVLAIEMWDRALKINPNHAGSKEYKNKAKAQLDALKVLPIK